MKYLKKPILMILNNKNVPAITSENYPQNDLEPTIL